MSEIKDTKAYSINDFLNWYDLGELTISPKYQRNSVWNNNAKSYLLDSIIKGYPVPQIFLRQLVDTKTRKTTREIIDGQQRIRTIIDFVENKFPILSSHNQVLGGKFYKDLDEEIQERFLQYNFAVEIIKLKEDSRIYEMFARLNTNNMALNYQELRNAKYWGEFKVFAYRKSAQYKSFFIDNKTFNDKELSRMLDVEYFSSIIIHMIDGIISESPKTIDNYYKRYDTVLNNLELIEKRIDNIFSVLIDLFDNALFQTKIFHRKNYLFTIFCTLNHEIYGLLEIERNDHFNEQNISNNTQLLTDKLMEFESNYERFLNGDYYSDDIEKFIVFEQNHRTRTTSSKERTERIKILAGSLI
jgi:hypothetical protein